MSYGELLAIRARLGDIEPKIAAIELHKDGVAQLLAELTERIEKLEAKRGPGRPPNNG